MEKELIKTTLFSMGFKDSKIFHKIVNLSKDIEEAIELLNLLNYGFNNSDFEKAIDSAKDTKDVITFLFDQSSRNYGMVNNDDNEIKMVILIRNDLKMSKGKIASQCIHAALSSIRMIRNSKNDKWINILRNWEHHDEKTVVLGVKNNQELIDLYEKCKKIDIPFSNIIADAGRTEIETGSTTSFSIGPYYSKIIDKISGELKLL